MTTVTFLISLIILKRRFINGARNETKWWHFTARDAAALSKLYAITVRKGETRGLICQNYPSRSDRTVRKCYRSFFRIGPEAKATRPPQLSPACSPHNIGIWAGLPIEQLFCLGGHLPLGMLGDPMNPKGSHCPES